MAGVASGEKRLLARYTSGNMRNLISVGLLLAWGAWMGGLAMALTAAPMYFARVGDVQAAGRAASLLFLHLERFQTVAAVCALVLSAILAVWPGGLVRRVLFALILLSALFAGISGYAITPRIEQMRQAGQTQAAEFKQYHAVSMLVLLAELTILAGCSIVMPKALCQEGQR